MKEGDYRKLEMTQNGMQVILEFPENADNEECIKREVKEILTNMLQENLAEIL